jgi:hypothetical protein
MSTPAQAFAPVLTNRLWLVCALLLWVGCSAAYFLTAPGRIDMFDGGIRHDVTESLIEIGMPAVRDPNFPGIPGRRGLRYAWYELGSSLAAVPFVWLGGALGHGSLESRQFAFAMTTVPFASGVVALLFMIYGRLGCSLPQALRWSLVVAFATLLWPYAGSTFDAAMQAFWLTLAVWASVEALAAESYAWAVVSAFSFAILINIQEAYVVLAGCAVGVLPVSFRGILQRLRHPIVMVVLAGAAAGLLLIGAANFARYGNPMTTGRQITTGPFPVWGNPMRGLAGLLLSPAKSIFLYSPTCVAALVGLYRLSIRHPNRFAPIVACLGLHLALISTLRFWHGEWAWGPRYLVATVPLVSIGLPFAWRQGRQRILKVALCGVGVYVQFLAISVDHQRYYFDRSLAPFFWLDEKWMYRDSPLFARPRELRNVLRGRDVKHVHAFVPGPRPLSMTSSIFAPAEPATGHFWMRQYLVFVVPRPWTMWSWYLTPEQRPGNLVGMMVAGVAAALLGFGGLFALIFLRRTPSSPSSQTKETEEETREHDLSSQTHR